MILEMVMFDADSTNSRNAPLFAFSGKLLWSFWNSLFIIDPVKGKNVCVCVCDGIFMFYRV